MVISQLSVIFSAIFTHYYQNPNISFRVCVNRLLLIIASFILFNCWWILNGFEAIRSVVPGMYSSDFAVSWANGIVKGYPALFCRTFSFTGLIGSDKTINYLTQFYNSTRSYFITLIPISIVVYYLIKRSIFDKYI